MNGFRTLALALAATASGCVLTYGIGGSQPVANRGTPALTTGFAVGAGGEIGRGKRGLTSSRIAGLVSLDSAVMFGDVDEPDYTSFGFGLAVRYERQLARHGQDRDVSLVGQASLGWNPEGDDASSPHATSLLGGLVGVGWTGRARRFRTCQLGVAVRHAAYDGEHGIWLIGLELGGAFGFDGRFLTDLLDGDRT